MTALRNPAPHVFIGRRPIDEAATEAGLRGRAQVPPAEEPVIAPSTPADRRRARQRQAAADYR